MQRSPYVLPLILLLAVSCGCGQRQDEAPPYPVLDELDPYLAERQLYVSRKGDLLDGIRKMYDAAQDPVQRYDIGLYAAKESFSYSFDSTQFYLMNCLDLAKQLGDRERHDQANILLGKLYDKSGYYKEAWTRLNDQIDTNLLSETLKVEYLMAMYLFSRDLSGSIGAVEIPPIQHRDIYRQQLYHLVDKDSRYWRELRLDELLGQGRLAEADSLARVMLGSVTPAEHDYAFYAFMLSEILAQQGDREGQMGWLVNSAKSDLVNAIRDYTSLTKIATILFEKDIDRSFTYFRIAQEDAIAYNDKLRPWQMSLLSMSIEEAYSNRQMTVRRNMTILSVLLASSTLLLLILSWFFIQRSRRLATIRKNLQEGNARLANANRELNSLNNQLVQSNRIKEKYLLDFLQRFSNSVSLYQAEENRARNMLKLGKAEQLLRELSLSTLTEKGIKEFYQTFDETFLAICPDFVERFNELLREDARLSPKPGTLTTELRIFALIRLGVDDSHKIASLLHYSRSTIYNCKVSVKNASLGPREHFEQRVKAIGK